MRRGAPAGDFLRVNGPMRSPRSPNTPLDAASVMLLLLTNEAERTEESG